MTTPSVGGRQPAARERTADPSAPRTRGGQRTATRILDGALELFNRDGTAHVTTNHIAAHVGISPGNLYYWFSDKDEIVRALWARFAGEHARLWEDEAGALPAPDETLARLSTVTELNRTYQFLSRDLLALIHADARLREQYVATRERRLELFTALARTWRADALVRSVDDERLGDLVQAIWILAETWWPFAELTTPSPDLKQGERLLRAVIEPYLNPSAAGAAGSPSGSSTKAGEAR